MGLKKTYMAGGKIGSVGKYGFGLAGVAEMFMRLKRADWPEVDRSVDPERFVNDTVLPFLLAEQARMFEDFEVPEAVREQYASSVIVTFSRRVFELALVKGLSPMPEARGVYSTGSGSEYALGYLGGVTKINEDTVLTALKAAAHNDGGSSGPFVVRTFR
jgi:hypothetical protein